ncbi:2-dehydro-3-deoxygalactonokinase [Caproiciproducens sp. R2]|uniref:2-dehydro-3-deoxygalactonokinase n=1 Tax=Caproiciproducens sp. R2 TaxID=3435187 RepID=UPI0040348B7F
MYAVIDCGTTNTRVYILNNENQMVGQAARKVGVRDTSMTGSKDALRNGLREAILEAIEKSGAKTKDIKYAIASGMITSEIGLMEIPHLVAPAGIRELAENVKIVSGREIISLDIPIMFIRGIRNNYGDNATLTEIDDVDFMRGEEAQVIGILDEYRIKEPVNILVLSSHSKMIHVNGDGKVEASMTTLSGQLFEAVINQTNVGKSLVPCDGEESGGYTFEEIVTFAERCVRTKGLVRCFMIPRFMQVLLKSDYMERRGFVDASIAVDDMNAIRSFDLKYNGGAYILFGPESRCKLYSYLLKKEYGENAKIVSVFDKEKLAELTVRGGVKIADLYRQLSEKGGIDHV